MDIQLHYNREKNWFELKLNGEPLGLQDKIIVEDFGFETGKVLKVTCTFFIDKKDILINERNLGT
jgi:hypothetical protein